MTIELAKQDRSSYHDDVLEGGLEPATNKVVVCPDAIDEYTGGGIALPPEVIEREVMAQIFATVVAIGPDAWKKGGFSRPCEAGDRVMIAKYTGQLFTGADGRKYRIIHDLDVIGRVTHEGVSK